MNGDLLTKVNFRSLLDFHTAAGCEATMCVREHKFEVPYGVVELQNDRFSRIVEKPQHGFLINAGIYVLDPGMLDHLPPSGACDMPSLFEAAHRAGGKVECFPIHEYWIDIGRMSDFERAHKEYSGVFQD